jgi:hypothetical protein
MHFRNMIIVLKRDYIVNMKMFLTEPSNFTCRARPGSIAAMKVFGIALSYMRFVLGQILCQ